MMLACLRRRLSVKPIGALSRCGRRTVPSEYWACSSRKLLTTTALETPSRGPVPSVAANLLPSARSVDGSWPAAPRGMWPPPSQWQLREQPHRPPVSPIWEHTPWVRPPIPRKPPAWRRQKRPRAVDDEIRWQLEHMSPEVSTALARLPALGTDPAGPLGTGLLATGALGSIIRRLQAGIGAATTASDRR